MIPSVVSHQVRRTILDYLRTTFDLADKSFEQAFFNFLDGPGGLFKGPYLDLRLPFQKAGDDYRSPLDIKPNFNPYAHQRMAFSRLHSKGGHQPQHTLITTGTGSGKTECFLYPILDHCYRNIGEPGIKAILLYPMNALATDQARRLAEMLWKDERLKGNVSAGLYVGGEGSHGAASATQLIDDKKTLRESPPDILLTNYKMLDFLLMRPDDKALWSQNGANTLRYLVLDELHTYDGAQGSDVACLIRRLKERLGAGPGSICCVGTSATIGEKGSEASKQSLIEFAATIFDEPDTIDDLSVITEQRQSVADALADPNANPNASPPIQDVKFRELPEPGALNDLAPDSFDTYEDWIQAQQLLWFGEEHVDAGVVELGNLVAAHSFTRDLLRALKGKARTYPDVSTRLEEMLDTEWSERGEEEHALLLRSFVALISKARRLSKEDREEPLLGVYNQLWTRELRHLVQRVDPPSEVPEFAWEVDLPSHQASSEENPYWLPIAHCRECGAHGFATFKHESELHLQDDLADIGRSWFDRSKTALFISYDRRDDGLDTLSASRENDDDRSEGSDEFRQYLCPHCLRLDLGKECACRQGQETIPVIVGNDLSDEQPRRFLQRCPECDARGGLSMMGSRAASLLSVAISHLFLSPYNIDSQKKLLAFTDSVQDASHRAGFFGARTYRFNLRTAMQGVLEADSDPVPLTEFADRLLAHWSTRIPKVKMLAAFLPSDLRDLSSYEDFVAKKGEGSFPELERDLLSRLSWEATIEYGHNVRAGRTLEGTRCSTLAFNLERLSTAARLLELEIQDTSPFDVDSAPSQIHPDLDASQERCAHFLSGLLQRLRVGGGIDHPFLHAYVESDAKRYLLSKSHNPLISPFGRNSIRPRFLTDKPADGLRRGSSEFESYQSRPSSNSWFRDWAARAFGIEKENAGINTLYREAVDRLTEVGLLTRYDISGHNTAWGLNPEHISITKDIAELSCPDCSRHVLLATGEAPAWDGMPCNRFRCKGSYRREPEPGETYYTRIYRAGRLERIYSEEHTGLLDRPVRELLEERFKEGKEPGAANLLVCTPTLELGVDIGDLSSTVLCSVPPTTANYVQRVGRAGRKTGNAFGLVLANSRPHDLYFEAEPEKMMAGDVIPPGCFLDAPEMLSRQLAAFAMDAWSRDEREMTSLPGRTTEVLQTKKSAGFLDRFAEFYRANRSELTTRFLDRFRDVTLEDTRTRIREFGESEDIPKRFYKAFEEVRRARDDLRLLREACRKRINEIEADSESVDDPEDLLRELNHTYSLLGGLMAAMGKKYPLNVLTDSGVLPNYAFPEPGVVLDSVVASDDRSGTRTYESFEYMRPASSAIQELAPFNTFYAEGLRVRINEIDVGTKARPLTEKWRLCAQCSYMRRHLADSPEEKECPRCADSRWADAGQVRTLIHFQRARSFETRLQATTADTQDEREQKFYQTADLIDVADENKNGAWYIEDLNFGFEFLKDLKLRELNFGQSGTSANQASVEVAGQAVNELAFPICLDCGRVRERAGQARWHASYCRGAKKGATERIENVFLYREIASEAIRILLPQVSFNLDCARASFRAALQYGLRLRFKGDPSHLQIKQMAEPARDGSGSRQFLVIFDAVPGGTGYLGDLSSDGKLLDILDEALKGLQACECQRDDTKDGCYRCLYAYQNQRSLRDISSKEAQSILSSILKQRDELKPVSTLSEVSIASRLESELEERFLAALRSRIEGVRLADSKWEERIESGYHWWIVRLGDESWKISAQVKLGNNEGVRTWSKPDFLIEPLDGNTEERRPVAIFCDGLAFHGCPEDKQGRIWDDIDKRQSILDSGRFLVWSVTWKDVEDFESAEDRDAGAPSIFREVDARKLESVHAQAGSSFSKRLGTHGSMELLLEYLATPNLEDWRKLADGLLFGWLATGPLVEPGDVHDLEDRLEREASYFKAEGLRHTTEAASLLARVDADPFLTVAARCLRASAATKHFGETKVLLRLFDEQEQRSDKAFEATWRKFLHAWNLLQFRENVLVLSTEFIEERGTTEEDAWRDLDDSLSDGLDEGKEAVREVLDTDLIELLEFVPSSCHILLRAVYDAGLPLPAEEFYLESGSGQDEREAELAWPAERVALLSDRQLEDRPIFEEAGWSVFLHPVNVDEILRALRANNDTKEPGVSQ